MSVTIGSNLLSMKVVNTLRLSSDRLGQTFERLSSGQRINRASDDAAGLAVASSLNFQSAVFAKALDNLNSGISALSIAEQGMNALTSIIIRQQELAEQSANGSLSNQQRISLDLEAQTLAAEYQRIIETTNFNGFNLLQSTAFLNLQAGIGDNSVLSAEILGLIQAGQIGPQEFQVQNSTGQQFSPVTFMHADLNGNGIQDLITFQIVSPFFGDMWDRDLRINVYLGNETGGFNHEDNSTQVIPFNNAGINSTHQFWVRYFGEDDPPHFKFLLAANPEGGADPGTGWRVDILINGTLDQESPDIYTPAPTQAQASASFDFTGNGHNDSFTGNGIASTFTATLQLEQEVAAVRSLSQQQISLSTAEGALSALDYLRELLDQVSSVKSNIGASLSRIETAISLVGVTRDEFKSAESRILDADIALETANLTRDTILQSIGASLLAQANINPSLALVLLGDN